MKKNNFTRIFFATNLFLFVIIVSNAQVFSWARSMGSINQDRGLAVAVDAAGNIYATGHFNDTVLLSPNTSGIMNFVSKGKSDIYLAKFSPSGNLIWARQIGGKEDDSGTGVAVSADQHVYLLATIRDSVTVNPGGVLDTLIADAGNLRDILVCKYDTTGNMIWAKQVSGAGDDQGRAIRIDKQGNVLFAGIFYATPDFDPSSGGVYNISSKGWNDFFVCKWSASGNFLWANGTGGVDSDDAYGLGIDSLDNVYVSGRFQRNADFDPSSFVSFNMAPLGLLDAFIVKYTSAGAFSWAKQIAGNLTTLDSAVVTGEAIITDKFGNVTLLGRFTKKVDFNFNSGVDTMRSSGKHDVFLMRLDTAGTYYWTKTFGGPTGDDMPGGFTTDKFGNFYIVGYFYGVADFNPSTSVASNMSSLGSWDVFINALSNNGNYLWSKRFGAGMFDTGAGIISDWNGKSIYSTGYFQQIPDFDTETPVFLLFSEGGEDAFLHKISQAAVGIDEKGESYSIHFYPNPANSFFNIEISENLKGAAYLIYDALGRIVDTGKLIDSRTSLDINDLSCGLYFVQVNGSNVNQTFKLLKN